MKLSIDENNTRIGEVKMLLLTVRNTDSGKLTTVSGCDFEEICLKTFTADEVKEVLWN